MSIGLALLMRELCAGAASVVLGVNVVGKRVCQSPDFTEMVRTRELKILRCKVNKLCGVK